MSRNFYSEIHLHIVWPTQQSRPLLDTQREPLVHRDLRERIVKTPGAFVHEIGGIETHLHVAVTIWPTISVRDWISQLKGGIAHDVNHASGVRAAAIQWQAGYGVVSFGTGDFDWVRAYIRN